jgi:hypothetical protein
MSLSSARLAGRPGAASKRYFVRLVQLQFCSSAISDSMIALLQRAGS